MAWSVIPTKLPQDTITTAEMNTYLRDNLEETIIARASATNGGLAMVSGPNEVTMRAPLRAVKSTTATTTSLTPASVGPTLGPISHSGQFLIMMQATIRCSTTGGVVTYCVGGTAGSALPTETRGVRTSHTEYVTLTSHILHYNLSSPLSFDGYLWTDNGAVTAQLQDARYTIIPF